MPGLPIIVAGATTVLTFAGCGYYVAALWCARAFVLRRRYAEPESFPSISIVKPIKGIDPEMYASFASHCTQDYPGEYEILFAIHDADDPAVAAIERLKGEYPERSIRLIVCPEVLGANGKVSNLVQAVPQARYSIILINDSDILVQRRYLRRIAAGFSAAPRGKGGIGMVTALYRGRPHRSLTSRLEALGISTEFAAGVLTARVMDRGMRFGLGSTLAVTREALDAIGGLAPLLGFLADDYELGARISAKGFEIVLSDEVVETSVPAYSWADFFLHQVRWSRTVRDARKWGYVGLLFSFGLPWALLNLIASGASVDSFALLSAALAGRVSVALLIGLGALDDRQVFGNLWLLPVRDFLSLGMWAWSFAGNTIKWRGETFRLKDGKLVK